MPTPSSLKVAELKELLKARGLAVNGKKAELVARLEEALKAEEGAGEGVEVEEVEEVEEEEVEVEVAIETAKTEKPEKTTKTKTAKKRQASEGGSSGVAKEEAVAAREEELNPKKKKSKTKDGAKQQQQPEAAPAGPAATDKKKAPSSAGGDLSTEASVLGAFFGDVDGQDRQDGQDAVVESGRSIADVYSGLLGGGKPKKEALQNLEFYGYLERCLVPLCASDASRLASVPCVMSIMLMLNEKFQKALPSWDAVTGEGAETGVASASASQARPEFPFAVFFRSVLTLLQVQDESPSSSSSSGRGGGFSQDESVVALTFLSNCVQSLENAVVRGQVMKAFGIGMWKWIPEDRRQVELQRRPELLVKKWRHVLKKEEKSPGAVFGAVETGFFPWVVERALDVLLRVAGDGGGGQGGKGGKGGQNGGKEGDLRFVEVALGLVVDVLSQLPTRRFAWTYLRRQNVLPKARLVLSRAEKLGHKKKSLMILASTVASVANMMAVDVDNLTGEVVTADDSMKTFYGTTQQVQRLFFKYWENLKDVSFLSAKEMASRDVMAEYLGRLSDADLKDLVCVQLKLATPKDFDVYGRQLLEDVFAEEMTMQTSSKRAVEDMPVYPTEALILNPSLIPEDREDMLELVAAVPKINVQFLSLPEYLERNFKLYLTEVGYDVRQHLVGVIKRMSPHLNDDGRVEFAGWSAMGVDVSQAPKVVDVRPADIGWNFPSRVLAEVRFTTRGMQNRVKVEWDQLREHDILLLVSFKDDTDGGMFDATRKVGDLEYLASRIRHVRGCEVKSICDEEGVNMNVPGEDREEEHDGKRGEKDPKGFKRTVTVEFDPVQYHKDEVAGDVSLYSSFQLIVRRNAKENNFKSVLKSIRDALMDENVKGGPMPEGKANSQASSHVTVLPTWLSDTFLGYGHPAESTSLGGEGGLPRRLTLDYQDTFVSERHVSECFPDHDIEWRGEGRNAPFKVTFADEASLRAGLGAPAPAASDGTPKLSIEGAEAVSPMANTQVEFTRAQVAAITRSLQPGLSLVVGPPGSGKTDTAVQILHTLYHNDKTERTLIITHSNQALNDIFQKLASKDIDVGEMIRLGQGERLLETEEEYDKLGRVNAMLERRMQLLNEIQELGESIGVLSALPPGAETDLTCETSASFWKLHVLPRWEKYSTQNGASEFPFQAFVESRGLSPELGSVSRIFDELQSLRPFEVLTRQRDRVKYMLTKQAKVIAMTCTHAAIKRQEFLDIGFGFDNILMEESAQILDIESVLPLTMQTDTSRLKRVVMIGDHNQLPPVVTNPLLKNHCRFEQSLFARLVRLGTPHIELNAQGRARPGIAALYSWRYKQLLNLPRTLQGAYALANPGFAYPMQFVDVGDFRGRGESQPQPHFYQNLGEAEYVVLTYQYMRLLGYPASSISVLTTYNGQAALLNDVFRAKCADHPLFGMPAAISTVDKFQGQQNDFILLSLVRTKRIGHVRDVRRLVVALSRARLGLYCFGRLSLFQQCQEIQSAMMHFQGQPPLLGLVEGEYVGMERARAAEDVPEGGLLVQGVEKMSDIVVRMEREWRSVNKV